MKKPTFVFKGKDRRTIRRAIDVLDQLQRMDTRRAALAAKHNGPAWVSGSTGVLAGAIGEIQLTLGDALSMVS